MKVNARHKELNLLLARLALFLDPRYKEAALAGTDFENSLLVEVSYDCAQSHCCRIFRLSVETASCRHTFLSASCAADFCCGLQKQAVTVWQMRGHDKASADRLIGQMRLYKLGQPPYNMLFGDPFDLKAWWLSLRTAATTEIADLGVLLGHLTPHAADVERMFSMVGWMDAPRRNRLAVGSLNMLAVVKSHHALHSPRYSFVDIPTSFLLKYH